MATIPVNASTKPAVDEIDRLIAALVKTGKAAGLTEKQIESMVSETKKAATDGVSNVNKLNKELGTIQTTLRNVASGFAGLMAIDTLKSIIGKVIEVTGQFQRFEAILSNTLGSKSLAQQALKDIQKFAISTPFQVNEITAAYVRWANQGLNPTIDKMKKLGDIGSALGAGFEQTAEAFKDLLVGQTKRIEEVGISATQNNGKIQLSFKGVNLEIEKTAEGVEKALDVYSQLNGVLGSADAIMTTLPGKISNFNDAIDKAANSKVAGDVIGGFVDHLTNLVNISTNENLSALQKLMIVLGGVDNPKLLANANEALQKLDELSAKEKENAIQSTVNAALKSGNVEAYIKALDQNIYKEEIIARIRQHQKEIELKNAAERQKYLDAEAKRSKELAEEYEKLAKMRAEFERDFVIEQEKYWQQLYQSADDYFNKLYTNKNILENFVPEADAPEQRDDTSYLEAKRNIARRKQLVDDFKHYSIMAGNEIFAAREYNVQRELAMLQQQYEYEISLAGTNDKAKEKIRQDFARKEAALLQKQASIQQQQALFNIAINEGPAIAKTIANVGMPWAIPLVVALGALFASQLNRSKSIKQPRYAATGDADVQGPGTETSDSIPYMLSVHEAVIPAKSNKRFGKLTRAMVEDPNMTWADLRDIVDRNLPTSLPPMIIAKGGADSPDVLNELKGMRRDIQSKQEHHWDIDENGFQHWVGRQGSWTKYISKRYSVK